MTREESAGTSDDQIVQAFARLTVHEFMLEVLMANWLLDMPEDDASEAVAVFRARFCNLRLDGYPTFASTSIDRWQDDLRVLQSHFLDKVPYRCSEIRAARLQEADRQQT